MKRQIHRLKKSDIQRIKAWLTLSDEENGNTCPFYDRVKKCAWVFPSLPLRRSLYKKCPYHIFPSKYVRGVAWEVMKTSS